MTWGPAWSPGPHCTQRRLPRGWALPAPGRCSPQCWRLWRRSPSRCSGCSTAGTCAAPLGPPRTTRPGPAGPPPPPPLWGAPPSAGGCAAPRSPRHPAPLTSLGPQLHPERPSCLASPGPTRKSLPHPPLPPSLPSSGRVAPFASEPPVHPQYDDPPNISVPQDESSRMRRQGQPPRVQLSSTSPRAGSHHQQPGCSPGVHQTPPQAPAGEGPWPTVAPSAKTGAQAQGGMPPGLWPRPTRAPGSLGSCSYFSLHRRKIGFSVRSGEPKAHRNMWQH